MNGVAELIGGIDARLDGAPLVVFLDVDGTLAPIAATPQVASVPASTRAVLERLLQLPNVRIALVSGRTAADAWRVAGVEGMWVIGNHGIELRTPDGAVSAKPDVARFEPLMQDAARALLPLEQHARGTLIENKRWTLSVHYRLVTESEVPDVIARAEDVGRRLGLRITRGKKIVELRPPIAVNKGTAATEFAEQHGALAGDGCVLYAGDDRTDEDAFRELRARSTRTVTIRISGGDENGSIETDAEFVLSSPEELRKGLEWLVARRANRNAARATAR